MNKATKVEMLEKLGRLHETSLWLILEAAHDHLTNDKNAEAIGKKKNLLPYTVKAVGDVAGDIGGVK